MDKITKEWLEQALIILKKKSSRHKLQDGYYWFICPEQTIDNVIIRAIEKTLNCSRITGYWIDSAGCDKCSICGAEYSDLYPDYSNTHFCPNCGAKMESGEVE